jgi:hypothetical protein
MAAAVMYTHLNSGCVTGAKARAYRGLVPGRGAIEGVGQGLLQHVVHARRQHLPRATTQE